MSEHPLVESARRTSQDEDGCTRAAGIAARIEGLAWDALACTEPDQARRLLAQAARALYQETTEYAGIQPAVQWIEATHRALHERARALFGGDAWRVVPPLAHEPLMTPQRGGRPSLF